MKVFNYLKLHAFIIHSKITPLNAQFKCVSILKKLRAPTHENDYILHVFIYIHTYYSVWDLNSLFKQLASSFSFKLNNWHMFFVKCVTLRKLVLNNCRLVNNLSQKLKIFPSKSKKNQHSCMAHDKWSTVHRSGHLI